MSWSKKNSECLSCGSTYFPHKARGLCTKCYRVEKEVQNIRLANSYKLDYYKAIYCDVRDSDKILGLPEKELKDHVIKCLRGKKLRNLKLYGKIQNDKIKLDTLSLEAVFNKIGQRCGKGDRFFTQDLMYFETRFKEEQRKIIALKLLKLVL